MENTFYIVYEGMNKQDNSLIKEFKHRLQALDYAKNSVYPYVIVNVYYGNKKNFDGNYINTIFEKWRN